MTINHENLRRLISKGKDFTSGIYCHADISALLDELTALRKENEELRVDAERYRWLRSSGITNQGQPFICRKIGSFSHWTYEFADASVDEAMAKDVARAAIGDSHE